MKIHVLSHFNNPIIEMLTRGKMPRMKTLRQERLKVLLEIESQENLVDCFASNYGNTSWVKGDDGEPLDDELSARESYLDSQDFLSELEALNEVLWSIECFKRGRFDLSKRALGAAEMLFFYWKD